MTTHTITRYLAGGEGLFMGISIDAVVIAAIKVAAGLMEGLIVAVFQDAGHKT